MKLSNEKLSKLLQPIAEKYLLQYGIENFSVTLEDDLRNDGNITIEVSLKEYDEVKITNSINKFRQEAQKLVDEYTDDYIVIISDKSPKKYKNYQIRNFVSQAKAYNLALDSY